MGFWEALRQKLKASGKTKIELWELLFQSLSEPGPRKPIGRQKRRRKVIGTAVFSFNRPGLALSRGLTPGFGVRKPSRMRRRKTPALA
jgi:hypothetical protein